jgi:hypothetical protein
LFISNSYLGPLITSPPQITVFTLYVIHALSTGTYNYKFYAYYWSLYKIQVLSWHVQWHWKCLACADFIKDLIWRVQLLNVFFSCSLWKILLFIP